MVFDAVAGEQKVTVEHVTVNEGGKAIVGNVMHGGRGPPKNRRLPHQRSLSVPEKPTLLGDFKANQKAVHGAGGQWLDRLPFHDAHDGGPKGTQNGMYRHGLFTKEATAKRRMIRELLRRSC